MTTLISRLAPETCPELLPWQAISGGQGGVDRRQEDPGGMIVHGKARQIKQTRQIGRISVRWWANFWEVWPTITQRRGQVVVFCWAGAELCGTRDWSNVCFLPGGHDRPAQWSAGLAGRAKILQGLPLCAVLGQNQLIYWNRTTPCVASLTGGHPDKTPEIAGEDHLAIIIISQLLQSISAQ